MAQTAPADVNAGRYGSGHSVRRIEDPALVAGSGRYVDDVSLPGQVHLVMLRSPYAHARIRAIDASGSAFGAVVPFSAAAFEAVLACAPAGAPVKATSALRGLRCAFAETASSYRACVL